MIREEEFEAFVFVLVSEKSSFEVSNAFYANRPSGLDSEIEQLAKDAQAASAEFLQGINSLASLDENFTEEEFQAVVLTLDSALEKYGRLALDFSKDYFRLFFIYLAGTVIGFIGFLVMLIKIKKLNRSIAEGEAKAKLWAPIRTGFIWIGAGFGITLASYWFVSSGGTYYIFYGLGIYGAYLIITGIYQFFNYKGNWEQFLLDDQRTREEKLRAKQEKNKGLAFRNPFKKKSAVVAPALGEFDNGFQPGPSFDQGPNFTQEETGFNKQNNFTSEERS